MLALKIIGGIIGTIGAVIVGMFVFFFVQAADEIRNCTLLTPDEYINGIPHHPAKRAYQCADGIHWQPHQ